MVVAYSWYISRQISGLRRLQTELTDRNRRESLQLLRIQNDLNQLGLAMRDMLDSGEPYPLSAWSTQFDRIRVDLNDALARQAEVAVARRTPEQNQFLSSSVTQFWDASNRIFDLARSGREEEARSQIRLSLQARQSSLSTLVARLLVQNNETEAAVAGQVQDIYDRVQRQVYRFLAATLVAIAATSLYLIRANRRVFAQLASLADERRGVAHQLIATREATLREISRELHDEFGQLLTAMGSMLGRASKQVPEGSPLRGDLREVSEIAQSALDSVRGRSQSLHPSILEELGLESTIDWYLSTVREAVRHRGELPATRRARHRRRAHSHSCLSCAAGGARERRAALRREARVRSSSRHDGQPGARGRGSRAGNRRGRLPTRARAGSHARTRRPPGWDPRIPAAAAGWYARAAQGAHCRADRRMTLRITVLLADDHHLVRRGFRRMLEDDPGIEVVGEAANGDDAIRLAAELRPRVVVMDAAMPGTSGLAATRSILSSTPGVAVLMLSMHSEETLVRQAMDAGARGYILKNVVDLDLAAAIKRVAAGETVLDPAVVRPAPLAGERNRLTARELEVLQLICEGLSNRDIAARLRVSANTVAVHRANIMNTLGVHKTAELVVYALQHGLVSPLPPSTNSGLT